MARRSKSVQFPVDTEMSESPGRHTTIVTLTGEFDQRNRNWASADCVDLQKFFADRNGKFFGFCFKPEGH